MRFTIYTKNNCAYCRLAKNFLEDKQLTYSEISLDNPAFLTDFKQRNPEVKTVPFIIDEEQNVVVGGYSDLRKHLNG